MSKFVVLTVLFFAYNLAPAVNAFPRPDSLPGLDNLPGIDGLPGLDNLGGIFDALNDFINSFPFDQLSKIPQLVGNRSTSVGVKGQPAEARTVAANPGGNVIQQFDLSGCLEEHNRRRPADRPLTTNANLVKISMARSIEQAKNREMTHDGRELTYQRLGLDRDSNGNKISYGENLYSLYSSNKGTWDLCKNALQSWVDNERAAWEQYKNRSDMWNYFHKWGHYTQCQWKTTTQVGCAGALIDNFYFSGSSTRWFAVFVTCTYQPAGNVNTGNNDVFRSNVLPLRTA